MKNRVKRSLLLAATMLAGAVLSSGVAFGQSCLNNSNPNLVKNGGFESGSGKNVPDWMIEWSTNIDKNVFLSESNVHSGIQDLALGSIRAANDIVQEIDNTQAGSIYTICFWLRSSPNPTAGVTSFDILWNNADVLQLTNSGEFDYQYLAVNVLAQGGNTDYLRIRERNKQGFYHIDDVAVQLCSGCGLAPDPSPSQKKKGFAGKL